MNNQQLVDNALDQLTAGSGSGGVNWPNIGGLQTSVSVSGFNWQSLAGINTTAINWEGINFSSIGTINGINPSSWLTSNQNITLSGDASGSGTTSISVTNSKVNGGAIPASATVIGTNGSNQFVAANTTGSGSTVVLQTSPNLTANVGIGSAQPGQALDVQGTVRALAHAVFGGTSSQFQKGNGSLDSTVYYAASNPNNYIATVMANSPLSGSGTSGSPLIFTNPGYISSIAPINLVSPNVGIGSTAPGQVLDVQGTIRSTNLIDTAFGTNNLTPQGNTTTLATTSGSFTANNLTKTNANGSIIDAGISLNTNSTANVGIGTNLPGGALTVMNGNVGIGTWNPVNLFQIGTGSTGLMVNSSGNVSIGTTTNTNSLTVGSTGQMSVSSAGLITTTNQITSGSNINSTSTSPTFGSNSTTSSSTTTYRGGVANNSEAIILSTTHAATDTTDNILFEVNNGTEVMRIQDFSGIANVGIGSTNPGQKLDVQGTIRAISGGTCTTLYQCNGGVDVGVIQTSACSLCPGGSCVAMSGCF